MKYLVLFIMMILNTGFGLSQTWIYSEEKQRYGLIINDITLLDSVRFYAVQGDYTEFFGTSYVVNDEFISYWAVANRPAGIYYVYAELYYKTATMTSQVEPMAWMVNADTLGRSFTTQMQLPPQVTLTEPADGAINIPVNVLLTWEATPYATFYQLQLSTDQYYVTTIVDVLLEDTEYYMEGLEYNTTYYWRVRAGNESGWGIWSGN